MSDHAQTEQPVQQQQESAPLFQVGERTYDVEAAKVKIENADKHISTIQSENATLREEMERLKAQVESSMKLDQVLDAVQAKGTPSSSPAENTTQAVDKEALIRELEESLTSKIEGTLTQAEQRKQAEATLNASIELAKSKYGSEYEAQLRKVGSELGLDDAGIREMASSKPELFKRTFNLEQAKVVNTSAPSSAVNSSIASSNSGNLEYDYSPCRTSAQRLAQLEHNQKVALAKLGQRA
jgi:hypothetical protein